MKRNLWLGAAVCLLALTGCTSFEDVKKQADSGNSDMQFQAAVMLMEGNGTAVDRKAAEKYLMSAFKSKNLSAACYVIENIYKSKQGDQANLLLEAYDILFAQKASAEFEQLKLLASYPADSIKYMVWLDKSGFVQSAFAVKKHILANINKCPLHRRSIYKYTLQANSYKTAYEKAEAKRIAEEAKRIAEAKRIEESKRIADAKRIAEEKRLAEYRKAKAAEEAKKIAEQKKAEEKAQFPLKGTVHTPVKLYKEIYSGLSKSYFYLKKLDEKYDRNVGMLWDDNLFPVRFKDFSIHEVSSGHISREFIALDSDKQIRKVLFELNSIRDPRFYYSSKNRQFFEDYNKYCFLIGIELKFQETENITVQSYIDKFKKEYTDLKQTGSLQPEKKSDNKTEEFKKQLTDIYKKLEILKNKLLPPTIYELSQKEINAVKLEIVKLQQELIYKTQSLALETSGSKRPELKLYNDNIIISFIKHDYHIAVKIKDAKLVEYRNMLNSEFRNAIKKYNAKGKEKQKNKELKQLDF